MTLSRRHSEVNEQEDPVSFLIASKYVDVCQANLIQTIKMRLFESFDNDSPVRKRFRASRVGLVDKNNVHLRSTGTYKSSAPRGSCLSESFT